MDQYPKGERPLNDIEAARLRVNLRMFFANYGELTETQEEAQVLKHDAADTLADALADTEANTTTAKTLIERHNPENDTITDLYAYYSLVRRARERHPGITLPSTLLSFIQELAQNHEEIDITFEMTMLLANMDDAETGKDKPPLESHFSESVKSITDSLINNVDMLHANLTDLSEGVKATLDACIGEQFDNDKKHLARQTGSPNALLNDIAANRFITPEGIAAAKAQQDKDRLASRQNSPNALLNDIAANRFITPEGIAAAKAQQDKDRLASRQNSPNALLNDIIANRFTTLEGLAAAKEQQDRARLALNQGSHNRLRLDLANNRILTPDGIAEAKRILGLE